MLKLWSVWFAAVLVQLPRAAPERAPACPAERAGCEDNIQRPDNQKIFFKVNNTKIYVESSSIQLTLECLNNNGWLDVASLPRYEEVEPVEKIFIKNCVLGPASVPALLSALNVREGDELTLDGVTETLRADQFAGLNISSLKLFRQYTDNSIRLEEDFFSVFQNLTSLETIGIQYERPPSGLVKWRSVNATLKQLYAECVSTLKELYLTEPELTEVSALSAAARLVTLSLEAPAGELPAPPALPALRTLTLHNWNVSRPRWPGSAELDWLRVEMSPLKLLPARWLSASPRLHTLELRNLPLRALPEDLLHANTELRQLMITNCGLTSDMLPDKLLDNNVNLEKLDLSRNKLTSLPSERLFLRLERLSELNLSHNRLRVPADAPAFVAGGTRALRVLRLDYNPLGDACAESRAGAVSSRAWSWLRELSQLSALSLQRTGATRICSDWLYNMPDLTLLDLQGNNFTNLTYSDLHPVRSARAQPTATIRLQGNKLLSRILYSAEDYRNAGAQKAQATVKINSELTCDCELFLFASALRLHPEHARVSTLVCGPGVQGPGAGARGPGRGARGPGRGLRDLPLDALSCEADCGDGCTCREVPARQGVLATCTRLTEDIARPRPDGMDVVELSLAGAGLSALPHAEQVPRGLRRLDLRNNSIANADPLSARAMLAGARLRLAGNPLRCDCGKRALVDLLLQYKERVDFEDLVCADGTPLSPAECGLAAGVLALLGVLAALAVAGVVLAGALAHPRLRARLKTALRVLGVHVPGARVPAQRYDAFVSFAEADARWVARELVPTLEGGPKPRRLCLHYRDWAVGEFIPKQITASVRDARRTILVVSDAFARSAWARAEFDEAMAVASRDGRPPPLVLLLSQPAETVLATAPALAEYLRAATYLRADDPRFRDKLRQAVPAQAPRKPPPPA